MYHRRFPAQALIEYSLVLFLCSVLAIGSLFVLTVPVGSILSVIAGQVGLAGPVSPGLPLMLAFPAP
jgi:hypothetical protein